MKRRKFSLNKLWRDKAPCNMLAQGAIIHLKTLDDVEYKHQLGLKLIEEAHEVHTTDNIDDLTSELADVLEVVKCIAQAHGISMDEIIKRQAEKIEQRGSFLERKFVTVAEYLPGSFGEKYALNDLERHPEIIEGN
jgi:predicted house-cleaning noncanonical NTP pyrophosphatase (MazG superfamily)